MRIPVLDILFVLLQLGLFVAFAFDVHACSIYFPVFIFWLGVILLVLGGFFTLVAALHLNVNLSPFPSPLPDSKLIVHGIYKKVRHPIYTGILMGFLGFSIIADSGYKLLITFLLFLLFYFKSKYEEKRLLLLFPEYEDYRKRSGRFLSKF